MKHFLLGLIAGVGITAVSATALTPGWQHSFAFPYRGSPGITKREYAAIMAMQGLLAKYGIGQHRDHMDLMAQEAWAAADALAAASSLPASSKECTP